ncbi:hypothetical protein [Lacisediminimonas profundi]|uniref:hypothetical protein n=1 Tax=Lacisediminimonas profundi TaxID=2603856 RepID=UPI00188361EE|nr:hypothetical protein [Lacisediminimonas profundi]
MRKSIFIVAAALTAPLFTGCASIVNGSNQALSVESRNDKGEPVTAAICRLENPKGIFYVTTPGTITVPRANDNLHVKCEKDAQAPGIASVKSSTKPMVFGNILFGGPVGAVIDVTSGAAYEYPGLITVVMGQTVVLPAQTAPEAPNQASPATNAQAANNQDSNASLLVQ